MNISHGIADKLRTAIQSLVLLLAVSLVTANSIADTHQVSIILSGNNPVYDKLAESISQKLQQSTDQFIQLNTHILSTDKPLKTQQINSSTLIVTVGASATHYALTTFADKPVIASFITQDVFNKLQTRFETNNLVGAVYLDQPAIRLLQLARLINPEITQLGTLTGSLSSSRVPDLESTARKLGLTINTQQLQAQDNPIKKLESIISTSQSYLVLPDKADFNRQTAKWIIYLSYRYRVPVIGYSSRYVDAGALVSIYSTPEQLGQQTAVLIRKRLEGFSKQNFQYPEKFIIRVNNKVKRSLGLPELDSEVLSQQLLMMEQKPGQLKKPAVLNQSD